MVSLMFAGSLTEVGGGPGGRGGPLEHPGESGGVVREGADRLFSHVEE